MQMDIGGGGETAGRRQAGYGMMPGIWGKLGTGTGVRKIFPRTSDIWPLRTGCVLFQRLAVFAGPCSRDGR